MLLVGFVEIIFTMCTEEGLAPPENLTTWEQPFLGFRELFGEENICANQTLSVIILTVGEV